MEVGYTFGPSAQNALDLVLCTLFCFPNLCLTLFFPDLIFYLSFNNWTWTCKLYYTYRVGRVLFIF